MLYPKFVEHLDEINVVVCIWMPSIPAKEIDIYSRTVFSEIQIYGRSDYSKIKLSVSVLVERYPVRKLVFGFICYKDNSFCESFLVLEAIRYLRYYFSLVRFVNE